MIGSPPPLGQVANTWILQSNLVELPDQDVYLDDTPNWEYLDTVLAELRISKARFARRYPYISLYETGWGGGIVIDTNLLDGEVE